MFLDHLNPLLIRLDEQTSRSKRFADNFQRFIKISFQNLTPKLKLSVYISVTFQTLIKFLLSFMHLTTDLYRLLYVRPNFVSIELDIVREQSTHRTRRTYVILNFEQHAQSNLVRA